MLVYVYMKQYILWSDMVDVRYGEGIIESIKMWKDEYNGEIIYIYIQWSMMHDMRKLKNVNIM